MATTEPFTIGADAATAFPLAIGAGLTVADLVAAHRGGPPTDRPSTLVRWRAALPWLCLVVAAVTWELIAYFSGPRAAHPTISSMYDAAARWTAVKAGLVLCWLWIGRELVRR
jgi:hypothetical protein